MSKRMAHRSTLALAGVLALVLGGAAMARNGGGADDHERLADVRRTWNHM